MTDNNTLMKLEYLLATLEGEASLCRRMEADLKGISGVRRAGMAYAYDEAAKALIGLIDDLKGDAQ
jgi:hypothetical protein